MTGLTQVPYDAADSTCREFLTLLGVAGLLTGCAVEQVAEPSGAPTRSFTDGLGRIVEVPQRPERIVALQQFGPGEALLALGAPLIGMAADEPGTGFNDPVQRFYDVTGVRPVGSFGAVDIETIATLQPDLIIAYAAGGEYHHDVAIDTLQQIAPTVALNEDQPRDAYQAAIADLTGLQDRLDAQRSTYRREIEAIRAELGPRLGQLSVSVVVYTEDDLSVHSTANPNPIGTAVLDLGLSMPPTADSTEIYVELSPERIADENAQADVILYEDRSKDPASLALWSRLPAVDAGQAHPIPTPAGTSYKSSIEVLRLLRPILAGSDPSIV